MSGANFSIVRVSTTIGYMDLVALGQRVQGLRAGRGMTLHELAEASGVSVSMLSSVERGVKAPTVVVLDRIAHGLGVRIGALVAEPDDARLGGVGCVGRCGGLAAHDPRPGHPRGELPVGECDLARRLRRRYLSRVRT